MIFELREMLGDDVPTVVARRCPVLAYSSTLEMNTICPHTTSGCL
jgi:hypothetical protein